MAWIPGSFFCRHSAPPGILQQLFVTLSSCNSILSSSIFNEYQARNTPVLWFFPAILPFGLLCWTALLFPATVNAFKLAFSAIRIFPRFNERKRNKDVSPETSKIPGTEIESSKTLFLLIWALAVPGLFSMSTCKLVPYIPLIQP